MNEIIVRYFFCETDEYKCKDENGIDKTSKYETLSSLVQKCLKELENELGYAFKFYLQPAKGLSRTSESSAYQLLKAAFNNEIVIVDGSLEQNKYKGKNIQDFGSNYECLTPAVMSMDNVLILSRTQIPLNFTPMRTNVKKLGVMEDKFNPANTDKRGYQLEYTNQQIIDWLKVEITNMANSGRLKRNPELKLDIANISNTEELLSKQNEILCENIDFMKSFNASSKKKCFISYRGCYYGRKKYNDKYDIEKVKTEIENYHNGNAEITVLAEGCLSNELMPEVRRWAFVCYIDRIIRECDEFWIFETKHKEKNGEIKEVGYWDSWWCMGEILTLLRLKNDILTNNKIKVMIFDPDAEESNKIREADISQWHTITPEENKELARYYANSDFLEAGYESVKKMRQMRQWPRFLRKLKFSIMKKLVYSQYANAVGDENFMDEYTFEDFENSIFSHVYDKSFMENRILSCGRCMNTNSSEAIVCDDNFIWNFLNINGEYTRKKNGIEQQACSIIISQKEFDYIVRDVKRVNNNLIKAGGAVMCNQNHLSVIHRTSDYFYIWWVPRMGKRIGPNKSIIEIVPLYSSTAIG